MTENVVETAINVTICGLAIVFGTLILLVVVISIFGLIMKNANGISAKNRTPKTEKGKSTAARVSEAPVAAQPPAQVAAVSDEDELIAVISAAVAAACAGSGKTFAVRNIRPAAAGARSVWAAAGVARNTRAF